MKRRTERPMPPPGTHSKTLSKKDPTLMPERSTHQALGGEGHQRIHHCRVEFGEIRQVPIEMNACISQRKPKSRENSLVGREGLLWPGRIGRSRFEVEDLQIDLRTRSQRSK
jgi:hypothetical protein